jgi:hypothetical protein
MSEDKEMMIEFINNLLKTPNLDLLPTSSVLGLLKMRLEDPYAFMQVKSVLDPVE